MRTTHALFRTALLIGAVVSVAPASADTFVFANETDDLVALGEPEYDTLVEGFEWADWDPYRTIDPFDSGIVQSLFGTCEQPRDVCPRSTWASTKHTVSVFRRLLASVGA
jgi:hypothetical protein